MPATAGFDSGEPCSVDRFDVLLRDHIGRPTHCPNAAIAEDQRVLNAGHDFFDVVGHEDSGRNGMTNVE